MTVRIRSALDTLPAYAPGRSVPGAVKLASNELPFPALPVVAQAVAEAVGTEHAGGINRYPDAGTTALADAEPGDEVLFGWRSFEAYPIVTQISGAIPGKVPVNARHALDLAALAAAITAR